MTDEPTRLPSLTLCVVYEDSPDLIEIQARVSVDDWSGAAVAYTTPNSLAEEARGLRNWTARLDGEFALDAGEEGAGRGWLSLRWYAIDRAGHLACDVQLATEAYRDRPESGRRLHLRFKTEPSRVERFARQLESMARSETGEAVLIGC